MGYTVWEVEFRFPERNHGSEVLSNSNAVDFFEAAGYQPNEVAHFVASYQKIVQLSKADRVVSSKVFIVNDLDSYYIDQQFITLNGKKYDSEIHHFSAKLGSAYLQWQTFLPNSESGATKIRPTVINVTTPTELTADFILKNSLDTYIFTGKQLPKMTPLSQLPSNQGLVGRLIPPYLDGAIREVEFIFDAGGNLSLVRGRNSDDKVSVIYALEYVAENKLPSTITKSFSIGENLLLYHAVWLRKSTKKSMKTVAATILHENQSAVIADYRLEPKKPVVYSIPSTVIKSLSSIQAQAVFTKGASPANMIVAIIALVLVFAGFKLIRSFLIYRSQQS